jgi:hypothetical protein
VANIQQKIKWLVSPVLIHPKRLTNGGISANFFWQQRSLSATLGCAKNCKTPSGTAWRGTQGARNHVLTLVKKAASKEAAFFVGATHGRD